ncbi:hypothetical protein GE061_005306 [Apolygus lucorum]|uniref:Uncharacterized protein n=1 Tax=Apolygus lucorum TaxID=248454 RepID=A0A6A4IHZ3_APOLU|nr:hypothetical protein GE061_005306 [Apolygus lucorum]
MSSGGRRQISIFTLTNSVECDGSGDGLRGPPSTNLTSSTLQIFDDLKQKCLQWSWRTIALIGGGTIGSAVLFRLMSNSKIL